MYERRARYKRRGYEAKKNFLFLISSLCLALVFALVFGSILSKADTKEYATNYYKYFTNIEIQPGDTLWELSEAYMGEQYESRADYIAEVLSINGLRDGDSIVSGQHLLLPYYSVEYK